MLHCPHCEHDFDPESQDQLGVYNAKNRILKAVCPECTKNFRLNREDSDKYLELFPDLKKEMQQMKIEKAISKDEPEEPPASDFEDKFRNALEIFGLNHKKYEPKIQAILKLIDRTGPSRDWLKYYMLKLSFTHKQNVDSIVDMVFIDEDAGGIVPPPPTGGTGNSGGYVQQVLPGGQILLVPAFQQPQTPYPQQPIIINPGGDRDDRHVRNDYDEGSIIEVLDGDGKVTKRIIKGAAARLNKDDGEDPTMKMIKTLQDLGIIGKRDNRDEHRTAEIPAEIRETLDSLNDAITTLGANIRGSPDREQNAELTKMSSTIESLNLKIEQYEKDKRDNETKAMRDEISEMKGMIRDIAAGKNKSDTPGNLTDAQFETHTKHKSLETITESGQNFLKQVTDPLNKILEGQTKLSSMVTVREMERTDGVPAGTYMKVLQPYAPPTDTQVSNTVKNWKDKAANTPVAQKAGAVT